MHVPGLHDKLQDIETLSEQIHVEDTHVLQYQERKEWMILADLSPQKLNNNIELVNSNNWHTHTFSYSPQPILEMPSWIRDQKPAFVTQVQNCNVDILISAQCNHEHLMQ